MKIVQGILLLIAMSAQSVWAVPSDEELTTQIVGTWASPPDHMYRAEKAFRAIGMYGYEQFNRDGSGAAVIRFGSYCGPAIITAPFKWKISRGVLIESGTMFGQPKVDHDRIQQIHSDRLILNSLESGRTEYSIRIEPCAIS